MADLEVNVVAADRSIWSGRARQVSAPSSDGQIGILVGHTPVLAVLRAGNLRVTTLAGEPLSWTVSGGFLSVDSDQVTVVVDSVGATTGRAAH